MSSATQQSRVKSSAEDRDGVARGSAVSEMVTRFGTRLGGVLNFDGFEYQCLAQAKRYVMGHPGVHTCSYSFCVGDDVLVGELTLSRASPFRESELQILETCLTDLCQQLYNRDRPTDTPAT